MHFFILLHYLFLDHFRGQKTAMAETRFSVVFTWRHQKLPPFHITVTLLETKNTNHILRKPYNEVFSIV